MFQLRLRVNYWEKFLEHLRIKDLSFLYALTILISFLVKLLTAICYRRTTKLLTNDWKKTMNSKLPQVIFKTRVREDLNTTSEFVWKDLDTEHYFANTKAILFSLPGAFTPVCSTLQLPSFEQLYSKFQVFRIDRIYCVSVEVLIYYLNNRLIILWVLTIF